MKTPPPELALRDVVGEHDHVASRLAFEGEDARAPLVTIAIPTFRRPDMLVETVRSALRQEFDRPYEIIVVDNDPASQGAEALVAALPELRGRSFRYYVNAENIGMYPNHNRGLKLARGEWISFLNDDDLLLPGFLRTMFAAFDRRPAVKGLVARKRRFDEREDNAEAPQSLKFKLGYGLLLESFFLGREIRPIRVSTSFWNNVSGNLVGFICRRDAALALGGFYPEDEWSADHWFYARFAVTFGLFQHRAALVAIRVARNESLRPEVLRSMIEQAVRMRRALVGFAVPRWYARLGPMLMAREHAFFRDYWGVDLSREELERDYRIKLPPDRPRVYHALRMLLRGF